MKNKLKNVGVLTFGLCVALALTPSNAAASEDDSLIDVNVLSKEDGKSSVVDVEVLNIPIIGDVKVDIPSEPETGDSGALATVGVSGGVIDDLDVSVLEKTDSKASVATVELESSLTDDVTVDVLSGEKTSNTFDGGVVEMNAEDLPLLGETHVGILDKHMTADEDGESYSSGLIQTDLNDGLLDDTSVDVLASAKSEDMSTEQERSSLVDVSIDDEGLLEDVEVSVLKRAKSDSESKASLASVELETSVTNDLNVDVASSDRTANSFDGGLVEVNGEDLPLLGETHVGVLDMHVITDEDGKSYSSGLIQTSLNDGLLDDASVSALATKVELAEDGGSVTSNDVSLNLDLPGTDGISVDLLKRQRQFVIAIDEAPNVTIPPTAGEDNDTEGNPPALEDEDTVSNVPESTDDASSDGNEEGATSNAEQGLFTPPANEGDSEDGFSGEEDGAMENNTSANDATEEPEQESATGNGLSGNVDADSGSRTGETSGTADVSSLFSPSQSNVMMGFAMNDAIPQSSLPKTGGSWDGKRLMILALALMATGAILRKMGKSTWSTA